LKRLHLKFLKSILGVRKTTSNAAVYSELGRYPLYVNRYARIIKYWFKLLTRDNVILQAVVTDSMQDIQCNKINWFSCVKDLLAKNGFYQVWLNPHAISANVFTNTFRQRLIDNYVQEKNNNVVSNNVLTLYKELKLSFEFEPYLDKLVSRNLRSGILTKLRLCAYNLRINTGRYEHLDRNVRYCQVCNIHEMEDEFHFVFNCSLYNKLRQRYINRVYTNRPSMYKLIEL